jgi:protein-disulfide isomerase-like protein with CxxC motif
MNIDTILKLITITDRVVNGLISLQEWQAKRNEIIFEIERIRERSGNPTEEDFNNLLERIDTAFDSISKRKDNV